MSLIEKKFIKTPLDIKKSYYFDPIRQAEYRRVVGGISWPFGDKPGFIVVIAENYPKDVRLKLRHLKVLEEYESRETEKLVKRLYDLQNTFLVSMWYGETENLLMMHFIDRFNQRLPQKKKKKGVFIAEAPFADDNHNLRLYAHQIRNKILPTKKSLHFGNNSRIPGYFSGMQDEDIRKDKAQKHPIIAALGFVIAGLDEPYFDIPKDREMHEQLAQSRMVEGL